MTPTKPVPDPIEGLMICGGELTPKDYEPHEGLKEALFGKPTPAITTDSPDSDKPTLPDEKATKA
jgi:hypothetical protein